MSTKTVTGGAALLSSKARGSNYRWYVLAILTLAQSCHALDRAIFGLMLESLRREFGLNDEQLGILAGFAYGAAFAVMAIPFGMVVDRWNRRNLLTVALTIWSGVTALCGLAGSYVMLLATRATVGAAESGGSPTGISILSDYFRAEERATATSIWYVSSGIGTALAFLGGGYVIQHYGWREACIAGGVPGICVAILLYFTVREPERGRSDPRDMGATHLGLLASFRAIAARPGLVHCMAGIILLAIPVSGVAAWITSFLVRSHGLSLMQIGMVVAMSMGLLGSVGGLAAGSGVDWFNRRHGRFNPMTPALMSTFTSLCAALLCVMVLLTGSAAIAVGAFLACGLMLNAHNGPSNSLAVTLAGPQIRGLTIATIQFGANLIGWGVGPLIVGVVSGHFDERNGVRWGLMSLLIFSLWGASHFVMAGRAARRTARPAP